MQACNSHPDIKPLKPQNTWPHLKTTAVKISANTLNRLLHVKLKNLPEKWKSTEFFFKHQIEKCNKKVFLVKTLQNADMLHKCD